MNLQSVSLQTGSGTLDAIRESLGDVSSLSSGIGTYIPLIIFLVIIVPLLIFGYTIYVRKRESSKYWGKGEHMGKVMFRFPKFWIHCNVSINSDFSDENLEELAKINKIKVAPDRIRHLIKEGVLHIYDCKITKYSARSLTRVRRRRLRIITTVPIESADYHSEDERGWRTSTNFFDPEKIKNVTVLKFTKRQVTNADHNIDTYWNCAILNLADLERKVEMIDIFSGETAEVKLECPILNISQDLVKLHDWTVDTVEAKKRIDVLENENEIYAKQLDSKSTRISAKNILVNKLKLGIEQKVLIGTEKPIVPRIRKSFIALAGALPIVGAMAYEVWGGIPEFATVTPWAGVMISSGIMILIYAYIEAKEKEKDEVDKIEEDD